jgi:hypothetical protein
LYLTIGKNLTNNKRFGVLFQTAPGAYQNFTWYPFMWQGGGDFLTKDGKSAFNSQATIQALKFWQDSINMGVAPRQCLGGGASDAVANLAAGYCAMQNVGYGRSPNCGKVPPILNMVFSGYQHLRAENTLPSAAVGRSWPTLKERTRRPQENAALGRSAP